MSRRVEHAEPMHLPFKVNEEHIGKHHRMAMGQPFEQHVPSSSGEASDSKDHSCTYTTDASGKTKEQRYHGSGKVSSPGSS